MNYSKINMDVCKALSVGDSIRGYWIESEEHGDLLVVIVDGFYGYFIPKDKIIFDVNRIKMLEVKPFHPDDFIKNENEIKRTDHFLKCNRQFCRRFDGNKYRVYVNQKFLEKVEKYPVAFFQNISPERDMSKQPVLCAEINGKGYKPIIVICPVAVFDDQ